KVNFKIIKIKTLDQKTRIYGYFCEFNWLKSEFLPSNWQTQKKKKQRKKFENKNLLYNKDI
ncbi:hypothetical protein MOV3098_02300, partial [Mesomycoplasma ovipneumoniae]